MKAGKTKKPSKKRIAEDLIAAARHARAIKAMRALELALKAQDSIHAYQLEQGMLDMREYSLDIEVDGFPYRLRLEPCE